MDRIPQKLHPNCAYGFVEIRNEKGQLKQSIMARIRLRDGAVILEEGLSRDSFDWISDEIVFRFYQSPKTLPLSDGEDLNFPDHQEIWFGLEEEDITTASRMPLHHSVE